jgi:hypothetical protein
MSQQAMERARELAVGLIKYAYDETSPTAPPKAEIDVAGLAAALDAVRLEEAKLIRDEYLDAGGWELVSKEEFG